jgi:hypothetical protein
LVVFDLFRLALRAHSRSALAAENLYMRLAQFQERQAKPPRADDSTRWMMVILSRIVACDFLAVTSWLGIHGDFPHPLRIRESWSWEPDERSTRT